METHLYKTDPNNPDTDGGARLDKEDFLLPMSKIYLLTVNNYYIYGAIATAPILGLMGRIAYIRKRKKVFEAYKAQIEQWEIEGIRGRVLSDFKDKWLK